MKNEEKDMIRINREERMQLKALGVKDGENGISRTHGTHKKSWYLCESKKNLALLNKIRNK